MISNSTRVTVVGLGYVGLPLSVALAEKFDVVGFDIDRSRIEELERGIDRTGQIDLDRLLSSDLKLTAGVDDCPSSDYIIVTVPTPIDSENRPDLSLIEAASGMVGGVLRRSVAKGRQPIVVYESTVYPGVTEEICAPILESSSGLVCGSDFFVAFSPERINPGDQEHTVDKITKVVSGQTQAVLNRVANLYEAITAGGVFRAPSIKVAEAAKVIENAQRDINIAFMNEIAQIFAAMGLSVWEVLKAAGTKWNFLPFSPGLVGGHCIGVDPYYLSHRAEELGHSPKVILAGRGVNDGMAEWTAERLHAACEGKSGRALVLGLTYKANVPDLRNSKIADLIERLRAAGHHVTAHDPVADPAEAQREFSFHIDDEALSHSYDLVVLAVPHDKYLAMSESGLRKLVAPHGVLADLTGALASSADWTL